MDLEKEYLLQNYARYPLVLARGKGCYLYDFAGKRYLDMITGIGVNALGHAHPRLVKVIREQAGLLIHTSNLYYHRYQGLLAKRLVQIYKSDQPDLVTVLLESDGFQDLLVRDDYMNRIGEQDSMIVDRVRKLKAESQQKKELLGKLKAQSEAAVAEIAAKRQELAQARAGIESRQGALAGAREQKRGSLSNVRESRHSLEGDLAALEAASAQVTAQLQGSGNAPAGPIRQGSGGFIWPVNGPVVSPFGMRWGRLHAGIDIAVPAGTPVRASKSGTVAIAGWVGGYGNYTCINHGGGIATCYAHQSSIGVSVGQSVKQGQVIGSSGCTGHCFGPHVHFEVRINGSPVDPMGYL